MSDVNSNLAISENVNIKDIRNIELATTPVNLIANDLEFEMKMFDDEIIHVDKNIALEETQMKHDRIKSWSDIDSNSKRQSSCNEADQLNENKESPSVKDEDFADKINYLIRRFCIDCRRTTGPRNLEVICSLCKRETKYQCSVYNCRRTYSVRLRIHRHIVVSHLHAPARYACEHCGKSFKWKTHLMKHQHRLCVKKTFTSGKMTYSCERCNYVSTQQNFKQHIANEHPEFKRYTCDKCHQWFMDNKSLLTHRIEFCAKNEYKCTTCNSRFAFEEDLRRHCAKTHRNETRKITDNRKDLQNKMKFNCERCDFVASLWQFKVHIENEHPDMIQHMCKDCNHWFLTSSGLRSHRIKHCSKNVSL